MDELHYVFQQINCSLSLNQPNILSALCAKLNAEVATINRYFFLNAPRWVYSKLLQ